ncbi:MAG: hypothetical protein IJR54_04490 [Oscillibacter sp.]|nr:hypothetical protein [Oscillibacter sp.]
MEETSRTRLKDIRQRLIAVGIEALSAQEILELLLSYVFPRSDNRALSESVLKKYGSIQNLLFSSVGQLKAVGGLNESAAVFLALIAQTGRQIFLESMERRPDTFAGVPDIGRYFMELVHGQSREMFYELCLSGNAFLACYPLPNGGQDLIRHSVEGALESAADNVAICRRQTGGLLTLSVKDAETAENLRAALDTVRVSFRDYLVVSDDDFVSLSESVSATQKGRIIEYVPF